jgi:hypothetical protein
MVIQSRRIEGTRKTRTKGASSDRKAGAGRSAAASDAIAASGAADGRCPIQRRGRLEACTMWRAREPLRKAGSPATAARTTSARAEARPVRGAHFVQSAHAALSTSSARGVTERSFAPRLGGLRFCASPRSCLHSTAGSSSISSIFHPCGVWMNTILIRSTVVIRSSEPLKL